MGGVVGQTRDGVVTGPCCACNNPDTRQRRPRKNRDRERASDEWTVSTLSEDVRSDDRSRALMDHRFGRRRELSPALTEGGDYMMELVVRSDEEEDALRPVGATYAFPAGASRSERGLYIGRQGSRRWRSSAGRSRSGRSILAAGVAGTAMVPSIVEDRDEELHPDRERFDESASDTTKSLDSRSLSRSLSHGVPVISRHRSRKLDAFVRSRRHGSSRRSLSPHRELPDVPEFPDPARSSQSLHGVRGIHGLHAQRQAQTQRALLRARRDARDSRGRRERRRDRDSRRQMVGSPTPSSTTSGSATASMSLPPGRGLGARQSRSLADTQQAHASPMRAFISALEEGEPLDGDMAHLFAAALREWSAAPRNANKSDARMRQDLRNMMRLFAQHAQEDAHDVNAELDLEEEEEEAPGDEQQDEKRDNAGVVQREREAHSESDEERSQSGSHSRGRDSSGEPGREQHLVQRRGRDRDRGHSLSSQHLSVPRGAERHVLPTAELTLERTVDEIMRARRSSSSLSAASHSPSASGSGRRASFDSSEERSLGAGKQHSEVLRGKASRSHSHDSDHVVFVNRDG